MRKTVLPLLLLLAASVRLPGADGGEEAVRVAAGETRATAVNAFNSRLEVDGKVDESIFLFGGSLRLGGEVTGDVICIAASVELGGNSVIGRDLIVIGGQLSRAEGARVSGRTYHVRTRQDLKRVAGSMLPFVPEEGGLTFFKVIKIFFWLLLTLLALAAFPAAVVQAAALLEARPLRRLGHGALALLLLLLLLLVSLLLSFVLIGIPLLIVLIAAYFLLLIFGRAAVFYSIGDRACRALGLKAGPVLFIVAGAAAYSLLKFLPLAGPILLFVLDLFALGIAGDFLLRRRKAAI